MEVKIIFNFLLGVFFISLLIPILDNILSICNQLTNHICTWIAVKTHNLEKLVSNNDEEGEDTTKKFSIGFKINSNDDNEGEE